MPTPFQAVRSAFALARQAKARHRDIADQLGISEAQLIAAHLDVPDQDTTAILHAIRLRDCWPEIVAALEPLGKVMALTRNASCVHEKVGVYRQASHRGQMGLVLGGAIDLRVFYQHWAHGYAVMEKSAEGFQRSLQFFDAAGVAIHKVFLRQDSVESAYEALVLRYADQQQQPGITVRPPPARVTELPDRSVDVAAFRLGWASLRDTHEFFGLLEKFSLTRTQALRLAPPQYVQQVEPACIAALVDNAAREGVAIMVFVANAGIIQIHSGPVKKVASMGPWLNVLDAEFNLHLREDHIASAWIVRKPTVDGMVTSVELFDADGNTIAMLFGERKPGRPELCAWRGIVETLALESEPCAA